MESLVVLIVIAVVVAIAVLWGVSAYNGLVRRRLRVDEAWAQIDVQLKRRHDLIPNLVNAVGDVMSFEEDVLTTVTEARAGAVAAGAAGPAAAGRAEGQLTAALRSLFAVVENYRNLKSNQNVLALQEELTTTENQIGFSRQHYNGVVRDYNTATATFPTAILARQFGFGPRDFFEAEPEARAVPEVRLR